MCNKVANYVYCMNILMLLLIIITIAHFDTIMLILYLRMFNINQIMFKVVWLICVREGDAIRKNPGNNRNNIVS